MGEVTERLRRYNDPTIYGESGELMQEAADMLETQATEIQQMALEYISEQGQWIDETASLYEMNLAQAKKIKAYQDLCDQLGNAVEEAMYANSTDVAKMLTHNALAAWREMEGGCDVPNSE